MGHSISAYQVKSINRNISSNRDCAFCREIGTGFKNDCGDTWIQKIWHHVEDTLTPFWLEVFVLRGNGAKNVV
eukprot:15326616-Ditylum_brightwellii.AAC.2